jgi:hypothetical protein
MDLTSQTATVQEAALKSVHEKARWMASRLDGALYDRTTICAVSWRDPEEKSAMQPLFADWFQTSYTHATKSTTSKAAFLSNPLSPLITLLQQYLDSHALFVPGVSLQIRDDLCHDEGMPSCVFEPHLRGEKCCHANALTIRPLAFPVPAGYASMVNGALLAWNT